MGGSNSGRWGGRRTTDAASSIVLAQLGLGEMFRHGGKVKGTATGGGITLRLHITVTGDRGSMALSYIAPSGTAMRYTVLLSSVKQHFGGRRWFFLCPQTGRRVRVLYRPALALFYASRQHHRLAYSSTRQTMQWRALNRSHKLRRRLDPDAEWADPIPARPCGMHTTTYEREAARIAALEQTASASLVAIVDRLKRQCAATSGRTT